MIFEHEDGGRFEVGGFQPFEAYDTGLANLDPGLERRPAPETVLDALAEFPEGLTTAEAASVMRASDLVDADPAAIGGSLGGAGGFRGRGAGPRRPRRHLANGGH